MPSFISGQDVAVEILQWLGYRSQLARAIVISYNMQDYDFWGGGVLSHLLMRQLSLGAKVTVVTTPPPGKPTQNAFKEKYRLLSQLDAKGVEIQLNELLHAKAYMFETSTGETTTIVGSPNLTIRGFGDRTAPSEDLIEMAYVTNVLDLFREASRFASQAIDQHARTSPYAAWFSKNSTEIGKAKI